MQEEKEYETEKQDGLKDRYEEGEKSGMKEGNRVRPETKQAGRKSGTR